MKGDPNMSAELRRLAFYGAGPKAAVAELSGEFQEVFPSTQPKKSLQASCAV